MVDLARACTGPWRLSQVIILSRVHIVHRLMCHVSGHSWTMGPWDTLNHVLKQSLWPIFAVARPGILPYRPGVELSSAGFVRQPTISTDHQSTAAKDCKQCNIARSDLNLHSMQCKLALQRQMRCLARSGSRGGRISPTPPAFRQ